MKIEKGYPLKTQINGLPEKAIYVYIDREMLSTSFTMVNEQNIRILALGVVGRVNIVEPLIFRAKEIWETLKEKNDLKESE